MKDLKTIIFTGVSGGGKTTALKAVEDLGFYCVDNLPLPLLGRFIELMQQEPSVESAALVVDSRVVTHFEGFVERFRELVSGGSILEVVYLDARDEILMRRFSSTRRPHPLGRDLMSALERERALLTPLRSLAGTCIDTSAMTVHQLKRVIQDRYESAGSRLTVSFVSFGYRHGLPSSADLVFDVRFLPNPFFDEALKPLSGLDRAVAEYVIKNDDTLEFLSQAEAMLRFLLPRYEAEGKVYLTVAIGCTGGQHRSVAIVQHLARVLGADRQVKVHHRDIEVGGHE